MWREMRIFADKHTINQAESSKTEAHSYPLWSVDSRGAGQFSYCYCIVYDHSHKILEDIGNT